MNPFMTIGIGIVLGLAFSVANLVILIRYQRSLVVEKRIGWVALVGFIGAYLYKASQGVHDESLLLGIIVFGMTSTVTCLYARAQK
ncbi:MAG: hypothetical protein ACFUZC_22755 [Chthoniobacteraceae bacterium]